MHVSVSLQKHKGFFLHFDSNLKFAKLSATMHFFQTKKNPQEKTLKKIKKMFLLAFVVVNAAIHKTLIFCTN